MPVRIRPTDLGVIYAAAEEGNSLTYVDRKGVTQQYIALTGSYLPMTTIETGGVDTSKPYLDATIGMTLAVKMEFDSITTLSLRMEFRRADEASNAAAWRPLQLVNQTSGVTAVDQTFTSAGGAEYFALQTASEFTAGQIRVLAKYTAGGPPADDALIIRCEAA